MDTELTPTSYQDAFLDKLIADKASVNIFLINGIRLAGRVSTYDRYIVILESPSGMQAVYKHAISTVSPAGGAPFQRNPETEHTRHTSYPRKTYNT